MNTHEQALWFDEIEPADAPAAGWEVANNVATILLTIAGIALAAT